MAQLDKLKVMIAAEGDAAASVDLLAILAGKDAAIADLTAKAAVIPPKKVGSEK
jgi:hypothetical protein